MAWCLTQKAEKALLKALRAEGDPQTMVNRGTEGRLEWFGQHVDKETAKQLNYLFETKMLLKSQQKGFESFVKYMGGSKQIKTDFLSKVGRLETALSKSEVTQYLEDFVGRRLGLAVTEEEFKTITTMSNKISTLKEGWNEETESWKSQATADKFGATQVAFNNYVESLKNPTKTVKQMLQDRGYQFKAEAESNKARAVARLLTDTA